MAAGDNKPKQVIDVLADGVAGVADRVANAAATGNYSSLSQDVSRELENMFGNLGRTVNPNRPEQFGPRVQQGTMGYRNPTNESYWQQTQTAQKIRNINQQRAQMAQRTGYHAPNAAVPQQRLQQQQNFVPALYRNLGSEKLNANIGMVAGLAVGTVSTLALGAVAMVAGWAGLVGALIFGIIPVGSFIGAGVSSSNLSAIQRFNKYVKSLNGKTYTEVEELARGTGKTAKFIRKDLQKMIDKGWFAQGHMDEEGLNLITSDETYQQYLQAMQSAEERAKVVDGYTGEQREIFQQGEQYINEIRECNKEIPDVDISAKLDRMEHSVRVIVDRAKQQPSLTQDLRRLMNYYLPTMVKLLHSYIDLDRQEKTSANIESSKQEVVRTIDMMNDAFDRLFDGLFDDTSLDISSDAEVMRQLLEQEGLTGHNFTSSISMPPSPVLS